MTAARAAYTDAQYDRAGRQQVDDWQRSRAARAYAAALATVVTGGDLPGARRGATRGGRRLVGVDRADPVVRRQR
ncbi:hypothetical protein [Dactylosporangium darangshiense]|uniref:Uncharacterized protein n=1 Tax=Dactylosporangium darangshiense TaxID=579108 RepID=A0ABP8DN49_9ACTN